jgi:hypothetical protein
MAKELPGFVDYLRQTRQNEAFQAWFRKQADRGLRTRLGWPEADARPRFPHGQVLSRRDISFRSLLSLTNQLNTVLRMQPVLGPAEDCLRVASNSLRRSCRDSGQQCMTSPRSRQTHERGAN